MFYGMSIYFLLKKLKIFLLIVFCNLTVTKNVIKSNFITGIKSNLITLKGKRLIFVAPCSADFSPKRFR